MSDDLHKDRPALSRAAVIGYGAASGPFEMLRGPGVAILPALYAKEFGFALTALSLAMLLLRLSDGLTDVAVGVLSDRTRSRWGPRKPWLLARSQGFRGPQRLRVRSDSTPTATSVSPSESRSSSMASDNAVKAKPNSLA